MVDCDAGAASMLCAITVTVTRLLRCCVTRRTGTIRQKRSHTNDLIHLKGVGVVVID